MSRSKVPLYKEKLKSPYWLALLDMIAWAEGATYNTLYGGGTFSDYSSHPNRIISTSRNRSSAAGRYQFMDFTYKEVWPLLGLPDFTPGNQDIAAMYLLLGKRAVKADWVENPTNANILKLFSVISWEWASIPPKRYPGQSLKTTSQLIAYLKRALDAREAGNSLDAEAAAQLAANGGASSGGGEGQLSTGFDLDNLSTFSALLTGENDCELPEFTQRSFLTYVGCLSKVANAKNANQYQLGSSAPGMRGAGEGATFGNLEELRALARQGDLLYPLDKQYPVSSRFADPRRSRHHGTDVACPVGTPLYASFDGKISISSTQYKNGKESGAGRYINLVDNDNTYLIKMFHLSKVLVEQGQKIEKGLKVAETGGAAGAPGSGSSTGPHLHIELVVKGKLVNPEIFFKFRG